MARDTKSKANNVTTTKNVDKSNGRSFCCSICIYTFVFVSGVIVATILPDLAGHHLKQPYAKEYSVMLEQTFKDLPKHLNNFAETASVIRHNLMDRFWAMKAEIDRRVAEMRNKKVDTSTTQQTTTKKTTTQRSTTKTTTTTAAATKQTTTTPRPTTTTQTTTTTPKPTTTTTQTTTTTPKPTTTTQTTTTTAKPTTTTQTTTTTTPKTTTTTQTTTPQPT
ncbi:unnamed protein product, partial [Rotaria sp. Silwood2]